jgi:hypothetical protein
LADGLAFAALAASNTNHPDEANTGIAAAVKLASEAAEVHLAQAIIFSNENRVADAIQELQFAHNADHAPKWVLEESVAILIKLSATPTTQGTPSV